MLASHRREFLQTAAAATATYVSAPALARSRRSPNDTIRVGLLGLGGRMASHVRSLAELAREENVEIVAVCDCDQNKLDSAATRYPELAGKKLKTYSDMRKMFDDQAIDAVSNALGDRWHALSTIWACQAGKDVYVEKPGTTNLFEGRQMVAAARKYDCIVQHGTQNRSSPNVREGMEQLRRGVIGQLYMARAIDYKLVGNLGRIKPAAVPQGLDWDQWLGPKRLRPYSEFWHRRWHYNMELCSGGFANQMIHELDMIRWGLGLNDHPTEVAAVGGKFVHDDDSTSPTNIAMTFRFGQPEPFVTCEHRSWYTNSEAGFRDQYPFVQPNFPVGVIFFGSLGYMIFPDYSSYYTFLGPKGEPGPSKAAEGHPMTDTPHFKNWLTAVRSRDRSLLNAEIEEGHKSMALSLLARAAYEANHPVKFDPVTERIIGDDKADAFLNRPQYRKPYVVPAQV
ncbi:MAG: Gfo/Idh/MocA family oxidoreductase [Planctomycetes bacterium]|nr:Gfo/Idh/MocA family oxidoreductase [Planctomycetota bacterium]